MPLPVPPLCLSPRLSFAVLRFFFLRSATPPPRATLASFTSFCRRRRRCRCRCRCHSRVRTVSLAPVWWRASPPRPHGRYVRSSTHAHACGSVRRRGTLCRCRRYIPGRPSRRVLTTYVLAPSRRARFLFLSCLPKMSLPRWPSSSCPSIALPFTPRSRVDPRSWERGPSSIGCRSAPLTGLTAANIIDRDLFWGCFFYLKSDLKTDQTMTFLHSFLNNSQYLSLKSSSFTDFSTFVFKLCKNLNRILLFNTTFYIKQIEKKYLILVI